MVAVSGGGAGEEVEGEEPVALLPELGEVGVGAGPPREPVPAALLWSMRPTAPELTTGAAVVAGPAGVAGLDDGEAAVGARRCTIPARATRRRSEASATSNPAPSTDHIRSWMRKNCRSIDHPSINNLPVVGWLQRKVMNSATRLSSRAFLGLAGHHRLRRPRVPCTRNSRSVPRPPLPLQSMTSVH